MESIILSMIYDIYNVNQLQIIVDTLIVNISKLKEKVLSNKISRGVGITRMEEVLALWKYGVEVKGYMDLISYGKLIKINFQFFQFLICCLFCLDLSFMFWFALCFVRLFFLLFWFPNVPFGLWSLSCCFVLYL